MKSKKRNKCRLQRHYEKIVEEYTKLFIKKHDYEEYSRDMWIGRYIGGIIEIGDMFVNFDDIRYDIDHYIEPELYGEYYYKSLECTSLGLSFPNYEHYCLGCPIPSNEQIENVRLARNILDDTIANVNGVKPY